MSAHTPPLAVELERVSVLYGERHALRSVSLRLHPGELVALAGPNGSGKSTLFRAVVGIEPTTGGSVRVGGAPVASLSMRERARKVGWMPQEEPEGDDLTVEEYVSYGRSPHLGGLLPVPDPDPESVERALRWTGSVPLAGRRIRALSGGERQRVRLARVFAQETPLLLLDEPTSHLDIGHQLDLLERVRALAHRPERCVVVALHDLNLAARFADRVLVLSHGQLVADGSPMEVLSPGLLKQVWGVDAELRRDAKDQVPYLIPRLAETTVYPRPGARRRVHVVAGGGSGGEVLRALVDDGYEVTAGALPLFDSDSALAEELGVASALEVPFAPLSPATCARVHELMVGAEAVVVAAFPVGPTNAANLEEVLRVARERRVLLLAQHPDRPWDFTAGRALSLRRQILEAGGVEVPDVESLRRALAGPPSPPTPSEGRPSAG